MTDRPTNIMCARKILLFCINPSSLRILLGIRCRIYNEFLSNFLAVCTNKTIGGKMHFKCVAAIKKKKMKMLPFENLTVQIV